jgi:hypothetical protein
MRMFEPARSFDRPATSSFAAKNFGADVSRERLVLQPWTAACGGTGCCTSESSRSGGRGNPSTGSNVGHDHARTIATHLLERVTPFLARSTVWPRALSRRPSH